MAGQLANKRCLLVGGTSGIGLAAAKRFVEESARVFVAGLAPPAEDLPNIPWATCNAVSATEVDALFAEAIRVLGGIDVLFHLAGGSGRRAGDAALHDCTDEGWRFTLDTNLTTTFHTNRAAVRHYLAERRPGVILNTASVLGMSPSPHHFDVTGYAVAKAGVIGLTRQAAARYAADGIRVNALAPGFIDTPMTERAMGEPAVLQFLQTKQPLTRGPGQPLDVAEAAVFLCSEAARFLTGVVLPVDGGWCLSEGQFSDAS